MMKNFRRTSMATVQVSGTRRVAYTMLELMIAV